MTKKRNLDILEEEKLLLDAIVEAILEKKGHNIIKLDLRNVHCSFGDYFIICHGTSTTQVDSIADSVYRKVKENMNITPGHIEGKQNSQWILMDYNSVIVHIFEEERRDYYKLEELWGDAEIINIFDN